MIVVFELPELSAAVKVILLYPHKRLPNTWERTVQFEFVVSSFPPLEIKNPLCRTLPRLQATCLNDEWFVMFTYYARNIDSLFSFIASKWRTWIGESKVKHNSAFHWTSNKKKENKDIFKRLLVCLASLQVTNGYINLLQFLLNIDRFLVCLLDWLIYVLKSRTRNTCYLCI